MIFGRLLEYQRIMNRPSPATRISAANIICSDNNLIRGVLMKLKQSCPIVHIISLDNG